MTTSLTKAASAKMSRLYSGRRLGSMVVANCLEPELKTGGPGERHAAVWGGRVAKGGEDGSGGAAGRVVMWAKAVSSWQVERRRGYGCRGWDRYDGGEVSGLCGAGADEHDVGKRAGAGEIISDEALSRLAVAMAAQPISTRLSCCARLCSTWFFPSSWTGWDGGRKENPGRGSDGPNPGTVQCWWHLSMQYTR